MENIRHNQNLSLKSIGVMCATSLSRETIVALKYIQRLSIKTKPKVAFTLKTKTIVTLILKTNKCQHLFVIYLILMGRVEFEGFRQDEVDQLEALLNSEVCEESGDEKNKEMKHEDVNIQWLRNQFKHVLLTLYL